MNYNLKNTFKAVLSLLATLLFCFQLSSQALVKGSGIRYYQGYTLATYSTATAPDISVGTEFAYFIDLEIVCKWDRVNNIWVPTNNILSQSGVPVHTPSTGDPFSYLDKDTGNLYKWNGAAWELLINAGSTVTSITNLGDTTSLTPITGDEFVNSTKDTSGVYSVDRWLLRFGGSGGGATTFAGLTDTPASYSGQANRMVLVNPGETGLIFVDTAGLGGGAGSTYVGYSKGNTPPSDTAVMWLNDTSTVQQVYTLEQYLQGEWKPIRYYDVVADYWSNEPPLSCLCTGQSNMVGEYAGGDTLRDARIIAWNETNNQLEQATTPGSGYNNNICFQFAKNYIKNHKRSVRYYLIAYGAQAIDVWMEGGIMYDSIRNELGRAQVENIDAILWHQGETTGSVSYEIGIDSLINDFRQEDWFGNYKPFIAGGLYNDIGNNAPSLSSSVLASLDFDGDPWTGFVESYGLHAPDNVHFSAEAIDTFGQRYLGVYLDMPQNESGIITYSKTTSGLYNSMRVGYSQNKTSILGQYNLFFGIESGLSIEEDAIRNVGAGYEALRLLSTGDRNVAFGAFAGNSITTGSDNAIVGYNSGPTVGTQVWNNILGSNVRINGSGNTVFSTNFNAACTSCLIWGQTPLNTSFAGRDNVFLGNTIARDFTDGDDNVFIGQDVANDLTESVLDINDMVGIGLRAFYQSSVLSDRSIAVGYYAGYLNAYDNVALFGAEATANADNQVVLGGASYTSLRARNYQFDIDQDLSSHDNSGLIYDLTSNTFSAEALTASTVNIADAESVFDSTTVEGALEELDEMSRNKFFYISGTNTLPLAKGNTTVILDGTTGPFTVTLTVTNLRAGDEVKVFCNGGSVTLDSSSGGFLRPSVGTNESTIPIDAEGYVLVWDGTNFYQVN